ncbi:hypothetical protein Lepto7375DRAFT_4982 [Leptolyngbya sp. PCC 7375]|nr:hypothetical protein Lepto7375DRAFT_4982 [Leptolyngbya sp. PCC 7375]
MLSYGLTVSDIHETDAGLNLKFKIHNSLNFALNPSRPGLPSKPHLVLT